ncbi:endonuclease/exonuclease/phosphatase family protein [Echinicola soli]|uniref:Endonuclease/exonuclease/phosphatase family protein n=1 Tax=Echinicola soli TaxID=2591634 RepID=A0A514CND1_9BACT|nr:endonuclease/exonuclease/phosphatase family protein [Echinicola soli]QDH81311.1 endonuclease/exonuclease/phosphatase family protein [Echinicola soli]
MKTLYFCWIALIGFSACASTETFSPAPDPVTEKPAGQGRSIEILCYNIHHCNPPSRPGVIDLESVARVIRDSGAEIVGLQEVDVYTERSGKSLHMAKELAEMTGMDYYYFSKGIDYQGGEYGTAILSKYPLSDTTTLLLPAEEGTEQRTLSVATVTLDEDTKIRFANTHLDYTSASNALSQAKKIISYFQDKTLPAIMVGDFNSVPNSGPILHLDGYFSRTCRNDCAPTSPADNPRKVIDFIMYKGKDDFNVGLHQVIQEPYASDHLPVKATLVLKE